MNRLGFSRHLAPVWFSLVRLVIEAFCQSVTLSEYFIIFHRAKWKCHSKREQNKEGGVGGGRGNGNWEWGSTAYINFTQILELNDCLNLIKNLLHLRTSQDDFMHLILWCSKKCLYRPFNWWRKIVYSCNGTNLLTLFSTDQWWRRGKQGTSFEVIFWTERQPCLVSVQTSVPGKNDRLFGVG